MQKSYEGEMQPLEVRFLACCTKCHVKTDSHTPWMKGEYNELWKDCFEE